MLKDQKHYIKYPVKLPNQSNIDFRLYHIGTTVIPKEN